MKVSEKWLREFVDPDRPVDEIAEALTTGGFEVDAVEQVAPAFDGVRVARIASLEAHPSRSDAWICRVEIGGSDPPYQVVCAAPNVGPDMRAPFALPGAHLGSDISVETADIAGVESQGMLCSAAELGIENDQAGIWRLPDDAPLGMDLAGYLELPDNVLELDLTPNRGDCLGMLGVAREVALTCDLNPLQITPAMVVTPVAGVSNTAREVIVSAPDACAAYLAREINGLGASAPTPPWLGERLRRAGVGAVSAPVDITNYVMLTLGQPMHAFDADALIGAIDVRYARSDESIVTLDGLEVALDAATLVIADEHGPVAIAGVIGGLRTAVGSATTNLVFEAACFTPAAVAGQGRRYKIQTDSLHRFERGVDPAMAAPAIEYATALCQQIAGGQPGAVTRADGAKLIAYQSEIELRASDIHRTLGQTVNPAFVTRTLEAIGMSVTRRDDSSWLATAPTWRFDLAIAADLIEEIARVYGYENIATDEGRVALTEPVNRLADPQVPLWLLRARGYSEAITYSFVDPAIQALLTGDNEALALDNPIADTMGVMRRSLWPGLLQAYLYNSRHYSSDVRLYERGLCFDLNAAAENGVVQVDKVAGLTAGRAEPTHWDVTDRGLDFFDVKGDVEALFSAAGRCDVVFEAASQPGLRPGRTALMRSGDEIVGWLGQLHDDPLKGSKNKDKPYVFEIKSRYLLPRDLVRYAAISDQPVVTRDLALVVADEVPAAQLTHSIRAVEPRALQSIQVVDVFRGRDLEAGFKSVALRLIFQDKTSTLTRESVDAVIAGVTEELAVTCGAYLRGS